jgi:hypothetical protein
LPQISPPRAATGGLIAAPLVRLLAFFSVRAKEKEEKEKKYS